jgi:unsaturated rhamnogalacturonyl hydrolase
VDNSPPAPHRALHFIDLYLRTWQPYRPFWNYEDGCIYKGLLDLADVTGRREYFEFVLREAGARVSPDGEITGFNPDEFNIDNANAGKALFPLLRATGEERFRLAIETQHAQLVRHPRTESGNYWHKKIYPWQVWLDGLYMAQPFRCAYAIHSGNTEILSDVLMQFANVRATMRDEATGLYFHGWDESRAERWSDPTTGCSPSFWGRAMGWFTMALVDCADLLRSPQSPGGSERRLRHLDEHLNEPLNELLSELLNGACLALANVRSANSLWFQVLDQGDRAGNYEESSASLMIAYAMMKGARLAILSPLCRAIGFEAYSACVAQFVTESELRGICSVAGLGNVPYRDGTYEYYLSEPVVANDPKGVGALMMATAEYLRNTTARRPVAQD